MTIDIHRPELEALIAERMESGVFDNVEEALLHALKTAPPPHSETCRAPVPTTSDFLAAMRSSPLQQLDLDHPRPLMPVRDVEL
jgi:hypothetical protein